LPLLRRTCAARRAAAPLPRLPAAAAARAPLRRDNGGCGGSYGVKGGYSHGVCGIISLWLVGIRGVWRHALLTAA